MKKIFFFMLCISKFLISSDTFTIFKHEKLRRLCCSIHRYLRHFSQEYGESSEELQLRMNREYGEFIIPDENKLIIVDGENRVERLYGYWGGDKKAGFYIESNCVVQGKNASFLERGFYEWVIDTPAQLSGEEFSNKDLQSFLGYIVTHRGVKLKVPVISYNFNNEIFNGSKSGVGPERKYIFANVTVEDTENQRLRITTRLSDR